MNRCLKHMKNEYGFTLIETVVSVLLLGIAVIPLSTIFTMTLERTLGTGHQLEANETAQQYMENLKNRDYEDFATLFAGSTELILDDHEADLAAIGLNQLPDGYTVRLSYDTAVDLPAYALPEVPAGDVEDVDLLISIPSGFAPETYVTDQTYSNNTTVQMPTVYSLHSEREILIRGDRATGSVTVSYVADGTPIGSGMTVQYDTGTIRFNMGSGSEGSQITTKVTVDSNLTSELRLFFYEDSDSTVEPIVTVNGGLVSVSRNLQEINEGTRRIVEIQVDVIHELSGEVLASITGTKINE